MKILKSFRFRLLAISVVFFCLAAAVVSVLVARSYQATLVNKHEEMYIRALETSAREISALLDNAYMQAAPYRKVNAVADYLFTSDFPDEKTRILSKYGFVQTLSEAIEGLGALNGVLYWKSDGHLAGVTTNWSVFQDHFDLLPVLGVSEEELHYHAIHWLGGYHLADFVHNINAESHSQSSYQMILGASTFNYTLSSSESPLSIIQLVLVSAEKLRETFSFLDTDGAVFLLDENGAQLTATEHPERMGQRLWFDEALRLNQSSSFLVEDGAGERWQIIAFAIPQTGWKLVKQIPFQVYQEPINHLFRESLQIGFWLMTGISILFALWIYKYLKPLRTISNALIRVRNGEMNLRICERMSTWEMALIRNEFNAMLDSIQNLIRSIRSMEHEHVELEIRNLQTHLNPHMVFNTISSIKWIAMMKGEASISDMLSEFSELIRPIFQEGHLSWSLQEELEYLQHYINLLRIRFGGALKVDISLKQGLEGYEVPCYLLQPLFENSCEYGRIAGSVLAITLEGFCRDGELWLCVTDNGCGISPEKLAQTLRRLSNPEPAGSGIHSGFGLYSIHRRLQMQYGAPYGLVVECPESGGTRITIHFPAVEASDRKGENVL